MVLRHVRIVAVSVLACLVAEVRGVNRLESFAPGWFSALFLRQPQASPSTTLPAPAISADQGGMRVNSAIADAQTPVAPAAAPAGAPQEVVSSTSAPGATQQPSSTGLPQPVPTEQAMTPSQAVVQQVPRQIIVPMPVQQMPQFPMGYPGMGMPMGYPGMMPGVAPAYVQAAPTVAPADVEALANQMSQLRQEVVNTNNQMWGAIRKVAVDVDRNRADVMAMTQDVSSLRGWRSGVPRAVSPNPPFSSECSGRQASCSDCTGTVTNSGSSCVWCEVEQRCYAGDASGPAGGECSLYKSGTCN